MHYFAVLCFYHCLIVQWSSWLVGWLVVFVIVVLNSKCHTHSHSFWSRIKGVLFSGIKSRAVASAALWFFNRKEKCVCIKSDDKVQLVKDLQVQYNMHSYRVCYIRSIHEWKINVLISLRMKKKTTLPHVICFIHTLVICFEVLTNWQTDYTTINPFFTLQIILIIGFQSLCLSGKIIHKHNSIIITIIIMIELLKSLNDSFIFIPLSRF